MGRQIQYFMWGYQDMYRVHVRVSAEFALKALDEGLGSKVFLVGILQEERGNRYPACVDPEDEHWISSEAFNGVVELASSIRQIYPEAQLHHSHPLARERADDWLHRRSIRDAILKIIDQNAARPEGETFFASIPELVEGYLVSAVLSVRSDTLNSRYRLASGEVNLHEYRTMPVSKSLIDAAIAEILSEAADGLLMPDPGLRTRNRETAETIRAAGHRLATDTVFRVNNRGDGGFHGFYEACDKISSLKYEQAEGQGRMLLARQDHVNIKRQITFDGDVGFADYRRIRKLLELASGQTALHTDSYTVFGLTDADVSNNPEEDAFEVIFLGHHHWELRHNRQLLMGVRFGKPYLPKLIDYEPKLRRDLPRIFTGIDSDAVELLVSLVRQAEKERHGTLLVISQDAASESARLKNQSTSIEPCLLTSELLSHLTGIDGAVLVDTRGHCHAIGVILDGLASEHGDPARGARFNSAMRYVRSAMERQIPTFAIVVSEDGGVDLIPDPPPMIKKSLLVATIDEIEQISRATPLMRRRYNELYDWLYLHRFYLLSADCERINAAVHEVERRLDEADLTAVRIIRHVFEPNPMMEPSFYYGPEDSKT